MNVDVKSKKVAKILGTIHHYNPDKYWKRSEYIVQKGGIKALKC